MTTLIAHLSRALPQRIRPSSKRARGREAFSRRCNGQSFPRTASSLSASLSCSPTMPWFDPVFHPPRPEARIGDKGKMTTGPSLEEGHSEGECRQDPELGEGCPGHDRQGHRVYRPIPEPGNQNDQGEQPPRDRLPSIESRRDALQPDAPRREEPEQNSDGNGDPDDRRKENQSRTRQSVRDQQKDEQANQERNTHGRADRESGNQLHPIRLIDLRRRKRPEYIKRKGAPVRTIDSS